MLACGEKSKREIAPVMKQLSGFNFPLAIIADQASTSVDRLDDDVSATYAGFLQAGSLRYHPGPVR
jgi:hypothetical protein